MKRDIIKSKNTSLITNEFSDIITEIHKARDRALQNINKELVQLYWNVGQRISKKIKSAQWGDGTVEKLSVYIKQKEPTIKGFNRRGLFRMRQFYETYEGNELVSAVLTQIGWTHHLLILSKTSSIKEKEFYLLLTLKEKYTTRELEHQIDSGYYERHLLARKTQNHFVSTALAQMQPDISKSFLDTYALDFLDLPNIYTEKDLQQRIVANLKKFILKTGQDFSFIGQNYRIQVGDKDFYIDLLFFHRHLQCLVAFELKITEFKPEYMGQLDFYLEALDREVKKEHEKPSIGILLCKSKNDEIVEFALNRSIPPTLISKYETELIDKALLKQKLIELYELEDQKQINQSEEKEENDKEEE